MRAALAMLAALVAGGCATVTRVRPRTSAVQQAQASHEYPSPPPPPQTAAGGSPTASAAIASFARAYINWSAQTVSADMRALAAASIGQARSAMQLAAAQIAGDYELQQGGIANSGQVEAVAPLLDGSGRYVVVTRELTTATATSAYQGLQPAWHLTIVSVAELGSGRWVVSGWQPEN
jgi:hypothetical protein